MPSCASPSHLGDAYLGRYLVWTSSGTTGEPGIFVQDEQSLAAFDALDALRLHGGPTVMGPWPAWGAHAALRLRRCHRRALCRRGQHRAAAPHRRVLLADAVAGADGADLLGAAPAGRAGQGVAGVRTHGADHLPELCRRAGADAVRRGAAAGAVGGVGRRRAVVGRAAHAHPHGIRLPRAQQLRLVRVLCHGLGMCRKAACT